MKTTEEWFPKPFNLLIVSFDDINSGLSYLLESSEIVT